ncbi:aldo/keto reductase [Actinotalea sp. JY-7885]|uniref:aldo/keto reductase n=1 Tax=Actinotalea sp. JY-7885 TaxID=2758576 RepID=UPI0021035780|nr:aldo/keto reductase [Actinotalea sp. JY-7885]
MPNLFGRDVPADEGVATVRAVLASPIRFLDTANGYSGGESERRIGRAIAEAGGLPPDMLLATKVDPSGRDYSGDRVRTSVAESRARLGVETLPLVHLHDPENFPFAEITAPGGALETLVALRDAGEVGAIGLAGGPVPEMARYLDLGVFDVLLVHNRWTLVDRSAGPLLDAAAERGMGVVNAAVHGGGILATGVTGEGPARYGYRTAPPEVVAAVDAMDRVCRDHGTDLATAALQFSLREPRVDATVVGMSRPARVAQTVAAASVELPDALFDDLDGLLPPPHAWLDAGWGR